MRDLCFFTLTFCPVELLGSCHFNIHLCCYLLSFVRCCRGGAHWHCWNCPWGLVGLSHICASHQAPGVKGGLQASEKEWASGA